MTYPILEFDPAREAFIEPSRVIKPRDFPAHCVICFFGEVLEKIVVEHHASVIAEIPWESGPHRVYEIAYHGQRLAFFHPGVGAPLSAGLLEEVIAMGSRKFIACGGCGVLEKDIAVGNIIVVSAAVRDEGVSYHYLPPSREVIAQPEGVKALTDLLSTRALPHRTGKTWTTDAVYRETPGRIASRRAEGCLVVEMEASALIAVARFRGVTLGQLLYGGDDLSGTEWDHRDWQSRAQVRESLFWLSAEACLNL
ncbi:MAG TPA: nucleoside phosphorylase [Anaerolineales bacterium]